jgi:hypothetical protein
MQFNSEANGDDIVSDIDYWAGTDVTSYPLAAKARNSNRALDRIVQLIFRADGTWQWDDDNQTDLPIATTDLVAGQRDYTLAVSHLKVERVRIKDAAGNWITLTAIDRRALPDTDLNASNGTPTQYDKIGSSFLPYPAPSYGSTAGFEVQFQRGASYFVPTDTTKSPGFASHLHRLIPLYAARDYCLKNDMTKRVSVITNEIKTLEMELVEHYSSRFKDQKVTITPEREDYGGSTLDHGSMGISENTFNIP